MDFSETNIKMCEKATKIQEEWKPQCGDYCVISHPRDRRVVIVSDGNTELKKLNKRQGFNVIFPESYEENRDFKFRDCVFFLPRQDQLQDMVTLDKGSSAIGKLARFNSFINTNPGLQSSKWSMEQLWLIYVMRWEYNKVWNGEDWI